MKKTFIFFLAVIFANVSCAQALEEIKVSPEWLAKIGTLMPNAPRVDAPKRNILVFSQHTGFYHWTIPNNDEMLKILATKTQAFDVTIAHDINSFEKEQLAKYDAVIFNNCNPSGPDRDLFADLMKKDSSLDDETIAKRSPIYEKNMLDYVANGGGLMILHGAITVQNNSMEFSKMTGGSFDFHPVQQEMHLKEVDPKHPLVQAFNGKGLTHVDEPYFFKNAYWDYDFHPLLYIDTTTLEGLKEKSKADITYVSWIKRYGRGRVFYSSASHNAQSMEKPGLLQFFLDGLQYVTGDLKCDDSPMKK